MSGGIHASGQACLPAAARRSMGAALFAACCAHAAPVVSTIEVALAGRDWRRQAGDGATSELHFDTAHRLTRTMSVAARTRQTLEIFALDGTWAIRDGRIAIVTNEAAGGIGAADCAIALLRPPHAFVLSNCRNDHGALGLSGTWIQAKGNRQLKP